MNHHDRRGAEKFAVARWLLNGVGTSDRFRWPIGL